MSRALPSRPRPAALPGRPAQAALLLPALLPLLVACGGAADPKDSGGVADAGPEPFALPADPALPGVPVGVQTATQDGVTLEIWYPAGDSVTGEPGEVVDFSVFVPSSVTDLIGPVDFPLLPTVAVRDAPLRRTDSPWPVILFSHGFGGTRLQSLDYATHLASRGYVVIAADHVGRSMGDLLPCMFSPALEGCDLTGFSSDPGPAGLTAALAWADAQAAGDWAGQIDPDTLGVSGHSAGGGSTSTFGEVEQRADALLSMAAGGDVAREVPMMLFAGSCDGIITIEDVSSSLDGLADAQQVTILGAGHLAFADLCALDLLGVAERQLEGRDDLNQGIYAGLLQLASDGCAGGTPAVARSECEGGFLPLEDSAPLVRHVPTVFFDLHLRGQGAPVEPGTLPYTEVSAP